MKLLRIFYRLVLSLSLFTLSSYGFGAEERRYSKKATQELQKQLKYFRTGERQVSLFRSPFAGEPKSLFDKVEGLLKARANPDCFTSDEDCPLQLAAQFGRSEFVSLLLRYGASHNMRRFGVMRTALWYAVDGNHVECARLLLDGRASPDIGDVDGEYPLHVAVRHQYLELTCLLLKKEYKANLNIQTRSDGSTPIHIAIGHRNRELTHLLLHAGANINTRNKRQLTPLHRAAQLGDLAIVRMLMDFGAWLWLEEEKKERKAFMYASMRGHIPVMVFLALWGSELDTGSIDLVEYYKFFLAFEPEFEVPDAVIMLGGIVRRYGSNRHYSFCEYSREERAGLLMSFVRAAAPPSFPEFLGEDITWLNEGLPVQYSMRNLIVRVGSRMYSLLTEIPHLLRDNWALIAWFTVELWALEIMPPSYYGR